MAYLGENSLKKIFTLIKDYLDSKFGNVENKSSATIRSEITKENVTDALGYTPVNDATTLPIEKGGTGQTTIANVYRHLICSSGANESPEYVVGFDSGYNNNGYTSVQNLRNTMGLGDTLGALPQANIEPYVHYGSGTSGSTGYIKIATLVIKQAYANSPMVIELVHRHNTSITSMLYITFASLNGVDPDISLFKYTGYNPSAYIYKSATSTWDLYVAKNSSYDTIGVLEYKQPFYTKDKITLTWTNEHATELPEGAIAATEAGVYALTSHGTHVTYSTTAPVMDGTASVGTATTVARSDHVHPSDTSKLSLSGGNMRGAVNSSVCGGTYLSGNQGVAIVNSTATAGNYTTLDKLNSTNGVFTDAVYKGTRLLNYTSNDTIEAGTNKVDKSVTLLDESGNSSFPGTVSASAFSGNASSATTLATARTIDGVSFDGSKAITHFGVCNDINFSGEAIVNLTGFELVKGARIIIYFKEFTNSSTPALTLNVNSTGAIPMMYNNEPVNVLFLNRHYKVYELVYDGTYWRFVGDMNDNMLIVGSSDEAIGNEAATNGNVHLNLLENYEVYNSNRIVGTGATTVTSDDVGDISIYSPVYTPEKLGFGYGTCSTEEATVDKVVSLASYNYVTNGIVSVNFTYAVPANATLNVNGKGAKKIYHRGVAITSGIIKAGDTATFMCKGSYYHLISVI